MEYLWIGNGNVDKWDDPKNWKGERVPPKDASGNIVKPVAIDFSEAKASDVPSLQHGYFNMNADELSIVMHSRECLSQYLGPWCVLPEAFITALDGIKAGTIKPNANTEVNAAHDDDRIFEMVQGSIAVIRINGFMMKGRSKFGGTSTIFTRQQLRAAAIDPKVEQIMLLIESPGGTAAGTMELAAEIERTNAIKPVIAQIEDMGASAAIWSAVFASRIFANTMAQVGSIGTVAVARDSSAAAKEAGIVVHVVSSGPLKGAHVPGTEVTAEHLAEMQKIVDALSDEFFGAVSDRRGLTGARLRAVTTGGVFMSAEAHELGLIDGIQSTEETFQMMLGEIDANRGNRGAAASKAKFGYTKQREE